MSAAQRIREHRCVCGSYHTHYSLQEGAWVCRACYCAGSHEFAGDLPPELALPTLEQARRIVAEVIAP